MPARPASSHRWMHKLESSIRKYYFFSGALKGVAISGVGLIFAPGRLPPSMLAFLGIMAICGMIFVDVVATYSRDMKWHRTLEREIGAEYLRQLDLAIETLGYSGIFWRNWIARKYDELYWRPSKREKSK